MKLQETSRLAIFLCVFALLSTIHPVYSATINVTSTADDLADDGVCTLREAVIAANENFPSGALVGECPAGSFGLDTIVLADPGIYSFSLHGTGEDAARTGDLDLLDDVNIEGSDAVTFIINAGYLDRIFDVIGSETDVNISGLMLTAGRVTGPNYKGGGIRNDGSLTVEDSIITGNTTDSAYGGGGIDSNGESLTITGTVLTNNQALGVGDGGAILHSRKLLIIRDCIFNNNSAQEGGAIDASGFSSVWSVTDTVFSRNIASHQGGAIVTDVGVDGVIENTTFISNSANDGGAIYADSDALLINNSTFNLNTASISGGAIYISKYSDDSTIKNVTFDQGYDIASSAVYLGSDSVSILNTLVAGRCDGNLVSSTGGNIETPGNTCGFNELTDQSGVSTTTVNLGLLKDNGGRTPTQLPGFNSIALERGVGFGCLFDDQREVIRPQDFDGLNSAECDVGAVELLPCQHDAVLTLNNTTNWIIPTFEACERIEAGDGFKVTDPDTIIRSGNAVVFTPGFSVLEGASLSVNINWAFWENIP